ncbi:response regulator transcription factor [Sutcliffiella cohnii]|uniref:DNA-binding response regulator n=1 Tax=Sutcliffiella cohnii TaxID=33932 RepID=A0A223KLX0_9BACI|nr:MULTISPECIES: response regulator transcription factor [Sutcliffiella]AST90500.1 DNA-binding response regulator [Sutcliffiella cohnii]MED4017381.1 response regulator transcription factor [Sutcliffiella cohnii]WBL16152.1 response regulator transcription factor [Sutcliffiella sp. NC1]
MKKIRVAVVDDHDMVRKGLLAYLYTEPSIEIVGEGASGKEAIELAHKEKPDVILMDLLMENGTGIDATKEIMKFHSSCKIIIITSFYDDEQVFPAIEAGAFSYLLKTANADDIIKAIQKAVSNEPVIEPKVASKMMNKFRTPLKQPHDNLTEREIEVLKCLGEGLTNQEIGEELFIGVKTVKTHVSNILSKLNVADRTQAAIYANRNGILKSKE